MSIHAVLWGVTLNAAGFCLINGISQLLCSRSAIPFRTWFLGSAFAAFLMIALLVK
jgi:hypothetical protein